MPEATEDEYFERELLDFLEEIESVKNKLNNKQAIGDEPTDTITPIITRFEKINCEMPEDQYTRVYAGLKILSDFVMPQPQLFARWTSLPQMFKVAKEYKAKYPVPKKDDQAMAELLKSVKEFAESADDSKATVVKTNDDTKDKEKEKEKEKSSHHSSHGHSHSSHRHPRSHHSGSKRSRSRSREKSRSLSRRRQRHEKSRSRSRSRSDSNYSNSSSHHTSSSRTHTSSSRRVDKWGLPLPTHSTDYVANMLGWQSRQQELAKDVDINVDNMARLTAFDESGVDICHGFNEGRCRVEACKYKHACWMCKSLEHPSLKCTYKTIRPYDAPKDVHVICVNWNLYGCNAGPVCADRHCCLYCEEPHPMRHSRSCMWKYQREVEDGKRENVFNQMTVESYEARQNILAVGFYEFQRARDEQSSPPSKPTTYVKAVPAGKDRNKIKKGLFDIDMNKDYYPALDADKPMTDITAVRKDSKGGTITSVNSPVSSLEKEKQINFDSIFATNVNKYETISITEICVLYNTPCGCPSETLKTESDEGEDSDNSPEGKDNTVECKLKHRCRDCFGFHSWMNCPLADNNITRFVVEDIVRYQGRVFTIGGFGPSGKGYKQQNDTKTNSTINININASTTTGTSTSTSTTTSSGEGSTTGGSSSSSSSSDSTNSTNLETSDLSNDATGSTVTAGTVKSPIIYINEVGGAQNVDVNGGEINKVISRLILHCRYPRLMIGELPSHVSKEDVQKRLKTLFVKKGVGNVVRFDAVSNSSNMLVSFKSKSDRDSAFEKLQGAEMHNRALLLVKTDEAEAAEIGCDEPMHEHVYYCNVCDVGLLNKYALRAHIQSPQHFNEISKKPRLKLSAEVESKVPSNKCILCDENTNGDMKSHLLSPKHDNNNILMMLSLVRCQMTQQYDCQVCRQSLPSSYEYFKHCRTPTHQSGLEEAIEPCPNYNRKNVGCNNDRCQFKHVCVACGATNPRHRCLNCRGQEICNMYNRGGHGCHFPTSQCHRKHVCLHCGGDHPKAGCPQLGMGHKRFDDSGRDITDSNNPFLPRAALGKTPYERTRPQFSGSVDRKRIGQDRGERGERDTSSTTTNRDRDRGNIGGRGGSSSGGGSRGRGGGTNVNISGIGFNRGDRDRDNTTRRSTYDRNRDTVRRGGNTTRYERSDRERGGGSGGGGGGDRRGSYGQGNTSNSMYGQTEGNNYSGHGSSSSHWSGQGQGQGQGQRPPPPPPPDDNYGQPPNMNWNHTQQSNHGYPPMHQNWGSQGWRANNNQWQ